MCENPKQYLISVFEEYEKRLRVREREREWIKKKKILNVCVCVRERREREREVFLLFTLVDCRTKNMFTRNYSRHNCVRSDEGKNVIFSVFGAKNTASFFRIDQNEVRRMTPTHSSGCKSKFCYNFNVLVRVLSWWGKI